MSDQLEVPAVRVRLTEAELTAVEGVLRRGQLVSGPQVHAFEEELSATLLDGRPTVAVNSGTSALHLGLLASGIGPGDEVIVPSFTFAATANAVAMTGALPVFVDIEPITFGLDPERVAAALTPRTKAVVAVHLFGHPVDWSGLVDVTADRDVMLVEDAAQAHGASYRGRPVGTLGSWAAFSFYATKNLMTGEGGMVACEDPDVADRVRLLRNQGMRTRYAYEVPGLNNRLTETAAALGREQLRTLRTRNDRRRQIARHYSECLVGAVTPQVAPDCVHAFHQYTVRVRQRDAVLERLRDRGIGVDVYYPTPTHRSPAYRTADHLPQSDAAAGECMSLPIHPLLTDDEIDLVIEEFNSVTANLEGRP